jgi:hypothetical protein
MMDEELIYSLHVLDRTAREYGAGGLHPSLMQAMAERDIPAQVRAGVFGPKVVIFPQSDRQARG